MNGWKDDLILLIVRLRRTGSLEGFIKKDICMAAVFIGVWAGMPLGAYGQTDLSISPTMGTEGSAEQIEDSAKQAAGETLLKVEEKPIKTVLNTIEAREVDIHDVLDQIALESGLEIIADEGIEGRITLYLKDADVDDALRIILDANNLAYLREGNSVRVIRAQDFEEQFGYPFSQKVQTRMIPLSHASFFDVGTLLNQMKSTTGKVFYSDVTKTIILIDAPEPLKAMADLIKELDVPVVIKTFELRYRRAKDLARDVQGLLTRNVGRIRLDESANYIIVTDTASQIEEIARRIEALDQPSSEILIETKILQIILNDEHRQGIDWEAIVSDFQSLKFEGFGNGGGGTLSLGTVSEEDYVILLDALDTVGMINTVSNVKMTVADGKTGEIVLSSDDLLSAYEREERGEVSGDRKAVPAGRQDVTYHITPEVTEDKSVVMRLRPEVASLAPGGDEQEKAALHVREGTTIVVGGLFKDVWVEATRKIPLLGDLPIVGFAFRNQQERRRGTEIIVFLTPKIILKE